MFTPKIFTMLIGTKYTGTRYTPKVKATAAEVTRFYTHKTEGLGITDKPLRAEIEEELPSFDEYAWLKDGELEDLKGNLATSIKDGNGNSTRSFKITVRTLKRMKAVAKAVTYLGRIRRNITKNELNWKHIAAFIVEYEALEKSAKATPPPVPKYNKGKGWLVFISRASPIR